MRASLVLETLAPTAGTSHLFPLEEASADQVSSERAAKRSRVD